MQNERAWREEYARFPDCTGDLTISHGMCMPVLNDFGSDELKAEFMPRGIAWHHFSGSHPLVPLSCPYPTAPLAAPLE